jgi:hypothetical protein
MSIITDKKYLSMVSSSLDKFAWKKDNLANCRCPICGDSQKNKNRARGYFYQKGNNIFYRCHNCGISTTLYKFLEEVSPALCREYALERWKGGENGHSNYTKPKFKFEQPSFDGKRIDLPSMVELSDDHECKEYVVSRKIPMDFLSDLFYAENFAEFVHGYIPDKQVGQEPRLIIPLRDADKKLVGFQGRAIYPSEVKYITIKFDENQEYLSYGMDRVDLNSTVYVTEGPIDSMFLPNAVAILGMNHELDPSVNDPVFVLDNEPRNREVIKQYEKLIKNDYRVCIWPDNITQKDVNDMVRSGMSRREVLETINKNIYSGLSAELRLSVWKKV